MDVISGIDKLRRFKELNDKGKARTPAEDTEFQGILTKNPEFKNILLYQRYAELVEMSGRSDIQEAELKNFEMNHPKIVEQYNRRKLGKGRRRTGRVRRGRGRRRKTRRS